MIGEMTDEKEWREFVNESKDATIFHTIEWKNVIEKTFKYKPHYLISKENSFGNGIFPIFQVNSFLFGKRFISLPFSFSAGPVYENEGMLSQFIGIAKHKLGRGKYLEIRTKRFLPKSIIEQFNLNESLDNYLSILKLKNEKYNWDEMNRKHRNAVRKSKKEGLIIREADSVEDLKTYYKIKVNLSAKKYGIPSEPFKFYKNMWNDLRPGGMFKLLLAEYNGNVVAGIILFMFKDEILYFSGGADEKYLYLKPYNLLIWEGIKFGCNNKYKTFNFGTSTDKGLLDFKEKWGAESFQIPVYSTIKIEKTETYNRFTSIWKKIPVSISKLFGPILVKHKGG